MTFTLNRGMGGYCVDLVICIDATGSMAPIINEIKGNALAFHKKFVASMEENGKEVEELRVKVIVFRDYICDSEPMLESPFYTLSNHGKDQSVEFKNFVDKIEAIGGGDTPENALEAFALALKSDWTTSGSRRRHAVVMFTDAPALALGERAECSNYPPNMPKTLAQLGSWWEGTDQVFSGSYQPKAGRFVAFVPQEQPWTEVQSWNRYWPVYTPGGTGLKDVDFQSVVSLMVGSF